jgi:hypothetical protein
MSAGRLVGASGINPVGSMTVSYSVFVRLVNASNGRNVIALWLVVAFYRHRRLLFALVA